ncbi:MAG: hypothetical protein DRJ64_07010, partial [Thermoprotei archaeon]
VIPLDSDPLQDFSSFNLYIFAFKNISCGLSLYKDTGYFTSKSYSKEKPGLIALDSSEVIPEIHNEETSTDEKMASFEYGIVKKNYNDAGELIESSSFPILPVGTQEIEKERLFFTGNNKFAKLRFLGHKSDNTADGILIYRNDVLLVRGVDWRFVDRADPLNNADDTLKPNLHSTRIEILHSPDVIRTGIYTGGYVPRYIEEPNIEVEEAGVVYLPNSTTQHKTKNGIDNVKRSDVFLKIAIRNNSRSTNRTPKLKSYKLMTASVTEDKHVRIK